MSGGTQLREIAECLPPQDLEAEQATLGAMLLDDIAVSRAAEIVTAEDFYRDAHREIYAAMMAVRDRGEPVDIVTVGAELRRRDRLEAIGGGEYLTALIGEVPTSAHVVRYATIVHDKALLRRQIAAGHAIMAAAYADPDDPTEATRVAQMEVLELTRETETERGTAHVADAEVRARLERQMEEPPGVSDVRTGIDTFDSRTGGLGAQNLVIVRAAPKTGKSIFAMQTALTTARRFREVRPQSAVVCYVLEAVERWRQRAVAWLGGFDSEWFRGRYGQPDETQVARFRAAWEELEQLPIYVNGRLRDVRDIAANARNLLHDPAVQAAGVRDIGLVVIDHAQRITGPGDQVTRFETIAEGLDELSIDLQCPVLVPSQVTVTDSGERRTKWSRALEENASLVFDLERGHDGDPPEVRQAAVQGVLRQGYSRDRSWGEVVYFVDVMYRRDLRMYDAEQWRAEGYAGGMAGHASGFDAEPYS